MNKKIGAITLLVLMSLAVALTPLTIVFGQDNSTVAIVEVAPLSSLLQYETLGQSQYNGTVGEAFDLQGTIYTSNGSYQILFGTTVLASGVSDGYYVNATFIVPSVPDGGYDLAVNDVAINSNSTGTTPETFEVLTGYYINAVPLQAQEGSSVALTVSVTGGDPNALYSANVSVALPSPITTVYSTIVSLGKSTDEGVASAQVTYSDNSTFQPSGGLLTDYAGTYTAYFNQSMPLAQNTFSVGFLDSTTYHRGSTVTVGATDYQPGQTAVLTVVNNETGATLYTSPSLTASAAGTINTTFTIPSNTAVAFYNATITPQGIQKAVLDVETFADPGYQIQVQTVNLANEAVPKIAVQAVDQASGTVYNGTTGSNGIVNFNLDAGSYPLTAFWNGTNVGEATLTVTGNATFTLQCQLTDLKILVQNENGVPMPFVNLVITYHFSPTSGGSVQTGNVSAQTNLSGIYTLNSTLTGITYLVNASLYGQVFNSGNNTVSDVPAQASSEAVFVCPNESLTLNVVGYNQAPIVGATIDLVELTSGLFYTATTDSSGSFSSQVTFGTYKLQVYENGVMVNQTDIPVFSATQQKIICSLYGIQVSVSVVDFFGQPISNANVTLNGPSAERLSAVTKSDGTATFNNVVGGDMQIIAFAQGAKNSYQAVTLNVENPTSVQIKLAGYVALGSILIPVSSLITIIIILIAVVLFAVVELYRRRKVKQSRVS